MERPLGMIGTIGQLKFESFQKLAFDIASEPTMLHPKPEEMEQSYMQNLAAVNIDPETGLIIGFARFEPLLNSKLRDQLNLTYGIPEIWELGTVFTGTNHRGNGDAAIIQNELLSHFKERILRKEILILLTAKPIAMIKTTQKAKLLGIDFYPCDHNEFEMIAPWTCVCNGDFGQGFQYGNHCPAGVSQNLRPVSKNLNRVIENSSNGIAACTMFVSDQELARYTNARLLEQFGSQRQLIDHLINLHYYPP